MITELPWDSEFFNLKIGEWNADDDGIPLVDLYDLLYVKSMHDKHHILEGFEHRFSETKVFFSKKPDESANLQSNVRPAILNDDLEVLYNLAYESGKYSRFRLDSGFSNDKFRQLYRAWVDNSLNRKIAADVLVYEASGKIAGMVTYKITGSNAAIGLIAVDPDVQGRGTGKKILSHLEKILADSGIAELRIPTQLENKTACAFYHRQGYSIIETSYIKHYWKK